MFSIDCESVTRRNVSPALPAAAVTASVWMHPHFPFIDYPCCNRNLSALLGGQGIDLFLNHGTKLLARSGSQAHGLAVRTLQPHLAIPIMDILLAL